MIYNTEQMLEKLINIKKEFYNDKDTEKLFKSLFIIFADNSRKNSKLKKYIKEIENELNILKNKINSLEDKE